MMETSFVAAGDRRSREEAERLVQEFEQSGMTRKAFSQAQGIAANTLDYYRRQYRKRHEPKAAKLLPVELVEAGSKRDTGLRVELANGRRITVEQGFDVSLLKRLIVALEG
jgi:transposase-like protein